MTVNYLSKNINMCNKFETAIDAKRAISFINQLNNLSKANSIAPLENISSTKIVEKAAEIFAYYDKDYNAPVGVRIERMAELSKGLKTCNNAIFYSKDWSQKIAFLLGFKNENEKELQSLISKTWYKGFELKWHKLQMNLVQTFAKYFLEKKNVLTELKKFNIKVLEKYGEIPFQSDTSEGVSAYDGINSYLKDLKDYEIELCKQNKPIPEKIKNAVKALSMASELTISAAMSGTEFQNEIFGQINHELHLLETVGNIGDVFIKNGGYKGGEGHSVIYEIRKTSDTTFTLTIVNTGEGCYINYPASYINLLTSIAIMKNDFDFVIDDIKYENIPFSGIDKNFINLMIADDRTTNMKDVYKRFDVLLQGKSCRRIGESHQPQHRGSCSLKSVSCWLHQYLGSELYNPFKVFVTQQELANIRSLKPKVSQEYQTLIEKMETSGEKVLAYRQKKFITPKKTSLLFAGIDSINKNIRNFLHS